MGRAGAGARRGRFLIGVAVAAVAVVYVVALWAVTNRHPVIADTLGYATAGERLADGSGLTWSDDLNAAVGPWFSPFTWMVPGDGEAMVFGNAVGYPALLAGARLMTGSSVAIHLVTPISALALALAAGWLGWVATRRRSIAAVAAATTAAAPVVVRFSTDTWSDVPVAAATTAALAVFLSLDRDGGSPRRHAAAGGALLGWAVLTRPPSAALLVALLVVEVVDLRRDRQVWRRRWPFHALAIAGVGSTLVAQQLVFGSPLGSKYQPELGWYPHPPFAPAYAVAGSFIGGPSLPALGGALLRAAPLVLLAPWGWRCIRRAARVLLPLALLALVAPYAVYAFPAVGENERFVLPAVPLVSILGASGVVALLRRVPWLPARRGAAALGVAAVVAAVAAPAGEALEQAADRRDEGKERVATARAIAGAVPEDAVLLAFRYNDLLQVHGGRSVLNYRRMPPSDPELGRYRAEMVEPCLTAAVGELMNLRRPVFFVADTEAPPWDARSVIERHFVTEPVAAPVPLLRIVSSLRLSEGPCRLLTGPKSRGRASGGEALPPLGGDRSTGGRRPVRGEIRWSAASR